MKRFLTAALALLMILSLAACGNRTEPGGSSGSSGASEPASSDAPGEAPDPASPEGAVDAALTAIRELDLEALPKHLKNYKSDASLPIPGESEELFRLIVRDLSYEILSSSQEGDAATVRCEIANADLDAAVQTFVGNYLGESMKRAASGEGALSDQEALEMARAAFEDAGDVHTAVVEVKLTKTGEGWVIEDDEAFWDAVLGGMVKTIRELTKAFGQSLLPGQG